MSTTITPAAPQLPDVHTAYDNFLAGVDQRVFFQKIAAYGLVPQTEQEAVLMLEDAAQLAELDQLGAGKQANDQGPVHQIHASLGGVLAQYGLDGGRQKEAAEYGVRRIAADLSQDPLLYNSVLALKAAEAAQIQAQFAQRAA